MARTKQQPIPTSDDVVKQIELLDIDGQLQVKFRLNEILDAKKKELESQKQDTEATIKKLETAL